MGHRILIYGATGYSGGLIAAEAARLLRTEWADTGHEVVLAARDETRLKRLADRLKLPCRAFGLDLPDRLMRSIGDFKVVLNAAGPFAYTAPALVRACILQGVHYVDICGEVDTYKALDDFGASALTRDVTLVCGAGHTATLSDVLLRHALAALGDTPLGNVYVVMSALSEFSRGSAKVMWRSVREQVAVLAAEGLADERRLRLTHRPIDQIQGSFDFGMPDDKGRCAPKRRLVSAANLVDTLVAKRCLTECLKGERRGALPERVVSFIEMDTVRRSIYQAGAWAAPMLGMPWVQRALGWQLSLLPEGPTATERQGHGHEVLLRVEGRFSDTLIDWRLRTPDVYDVTARCAMEVAAAVPDKLWFGWQTPGRFVKPLPARLLSEGGMCTGLALRDCELHAARTPALSSEVAA